MDIEFVQRRTKRLDHRRRKVCKRRVHDRCVFTLDKPDATDFTRQGNLDAWNLLIQDFCHACFHRIIDRGEDARNDNRGNTTLFDIASGFCNGPFVKPVDLGSIKIVAPLDEV